MLAQTAARLHGDWTSCAQVPIPATERPEPGAEAVCSTREEGSGGSLGRRKGTRSVWDPGEADGAITMSCALPVGRGDGKMSNLSALATMMPLANMYVMSYMSGGDSVPKKDKESTSQRD